ncbi:pisatin demethylase [Diplogelasinospora grovesii]|uniref:Pisatin demethylase n=1 Tax=Diplogelasinospora grovesii TaxID=303347 RepID=A0AAN6N1B1_9PEZI|nr:pisatin demethylase [Diplogelasinospora grovesii]
MVGVFQATFAHLDSSSGVAGERFLGLLVAVFFVYAASIVVSTIRQYYRLRHIPGPRIAGFSKWWLLQGETGGRMNLECYEITEKYGSLARIGPNDLLTSDPDLMRRMLNVRTNYQRSDWYYAMRFDPSKDNVLSMMDDAKHTKLRAKMAAGYSGKEVEGLEPKIDKNILAFMDLLDSRYVSLAKPFDFGRKAQFFTLDVISDVAYGQAFGFMATDSDMFNYIEILERQMPKIISTTVYPWLVDVLSSPVFKSLLPSHKDALGFGKVMGIAREKAAERFGPNKIVRNDMLGSFVAHGLTLEEAGSETLMQILAGSDTTATAVRATTLHIMTSPRVVNRLHAELDKAGVFGRPLDRIIGDAEARSLPYVQAIVKEGLRIFPPVVGLMSKVVPKGGDTFKGVYLPEGTKVGYCAWGIMRRREVWGDDASEFRPERWLEATPEKLKEMESTLELVFSYGRWQCLGKNIALMELNKVFVELFRRYELVLVDPTRPWKSRNVGIFNQSEFWIKGYKRQLE